jgi:hypothetical protein
MSSSVAVAGEQEERIPTVAVESEDMACNNDQFQTVATITVSVCYNYLEFFLSKVVQLV